MLGAWPRGSFFGTAARSWTDIGPRDQSQSTGLGWTLDVGGFVVRDTKNTTGPADDTFKLVFNGAAHDLVLVDAGQNIYHTKDEIWARLQYNEQSDYWTLTTKDGTTHRFGFNSDSKAIALGQDLQTQITYKYLLDRVTTTSGVAVTYSYVKQTATRYGGTQTYDQAVYPDTIRWAYKDGQAVGDLRQVTFIRGPRTDYTDTSMSTYVSFFESQRIEAIEVRIGSALVRKYALGFDYSVDRDLTYTWGGGATGDLTLRSFTVYGSDGASTLPPLSFEYGNARLSRVTNGSSGTVTFTYEAVTTVPLYAAYLGGWSGEMWVCGADTYPSTSSDPSCGGSLLGYLLTAPFAG